MNRPKDYHTKWSESEKDKYHDSTYILKIKKKKMIQMNLFIEQE